MMVPISMNFLLKFMRLRSVAAGIISAGIDFVIVASFGVAPGKLPISWPLYFAFFFSQLFLLLISGPTHGADVRKGSKLRASGGLLSIPAFTQGFVDPLRVPHFANAAVVAGQGLGAVTAFAVQVEFEYGAAEAQVGVNIEQVVARSADFVQPEWHDLHQATGACIRDGKAVKVAFDVNQREHQLGGQLGTGGFVVRGLQDKEPFPRIFYFSFQSVRHVCQPDFCFKPVVEAV